MTPSDIAPAPSTCVRNSGNSGYTISLAMSVKKLTHPSSQTGRERRNGFSESTRGRAKGAIRDRDSGLGVRDSGFGHSRFGGPGSGNYNWRLVTVYSRSGAATIWSGRAWS